MAKGKARWWVVFVRPPLVALRFVLSPVYSALFGWLDKRLHARDRKRLEQDVRDALPFLFGKFQGRVVPDEYETQSLHFDYASVTVALDDFLLRFWRGRGDLSVWVAPVFRPPDQHELSLVLSAIAGDGQIVRAQFVDLWHVSRALEPNLPAIQELFSLSRFDDLKHRLDKEVYDVDRVMIKAWESEINRRLYGQ